MKQILVFFLTLSAALAPDPCCIGGKGGIGGKAGIGGGVSPGHSFGRSFDGSTQALKRTAALNLSSVSTISVAFWEWQNSFSVANAIMVELTSTGNNQAGGFSINSDVSSTISFGWAGGTSGASAGTVTQPSTGAWHQYLFLLTPTAAGLKVFIDGSSKTVTTGGSPAVGNFANDKIYLMSRNDASLWNAGKMAEFAVWTADESANASALWNGGSGALASTIDAGNLVTYAHFCGTASPEPDQITSSWTLTATPPQVAGPGLINCP